jgi:hypothetical protein
VGLVLFYTPLLFALVSWILSFWPSIRAPHLKTSIVALLLLHYLTQRCAQLSASSAALDLALSPSPNPETASSSRSWSRIVNRHRPQQSLSSINGTSNIVSDLVGLASRPASLRHSIDLKYISENAIENGHIMSANGNPNMTPPKLQSSFSSNDIPTVKSPGGSSSKANSHAQQHFHNHNASLGRIPAGAIHRGHSRELSSDNTAVSREQPNYPSIQSALQASAAPFGPSSTAPVPPSSMANTSAGAYAAGNNFNNNGFYPGNGYGTPHGVPQGAVPQGAPQGAPQGVAQGATHQPGGYNVNMLANSMQQMNMNGMNGGNMYGQPQNYNGYNTGPYNQGNQPRDSQTRVMQHRRQLDNEGKFILKSSGIWIKTNLILQPCLATRTCPLIPSWAPSTIFARTSTAAVTSRRSLKNATPIRFT